MKVRRQRNIGSFYKYKIEQKLNCLLDLQTANIVTRNGGQDAGAERQKKRKGAAIPTVT